MLFFLVKIRQIRGYLNKYISNNHYFMKMSTIIITILVLTLGFFLKNNLKRTSEVSSFSSEKPRNMKKEVLTEAFYKKRFEEIGLSAHWDFFKTLLKNEIQMEPTASNEAALGLGQSKIGGQPDLPKHTHVRSCTLLPKANRVLRRHLYES
jgi:hypothetical protein